MVTGLTEIGRERISYNTHLVSLITYNISLEREFLRGVGFVKKRG